MVNLISNAIKFTEQGIVRIKIGWAKKILTISVEDSGKGIAEANQNRIFTAFERIGKQSGSGLGLSIVKHLVEAMNGQLSLTSQVSEGQPLRCIYTFRTNHCDYPGMLSSFTKR